MSDTVEPWTIERVCAALGNPTLAQRCVSEINRAPAYQLMNVFAKWQGIAERTLEAVARGQALHANAGSGGELPGDFIEYTVDDLRAKAEQLRARDAA
ncbi:hypothetical protein [Kitasatospora sp. NPDC001175]|uniref:hypothetical protein n=1 Tax=Kitasatospora sp. NPDC001175 TaxID=3157103 RepID=UPI003D02D264